MPFSERKGRFVVTVDDGSAKGRPGSSPGEAQRREKRGRFTISTCLPCLSQGTRTLSGDSEGYDIALLPAGARDQRPQAQQQHGAPPSSSLARGRDQRGAGRLPLECDASSSSLEDSASCTSACTADSTASAATACSSGAGNAAGVRPARRVRFSEPGCGARSGLAPGEALLQLLPPLRADAPAHSQPQAITRSYCRGRFVVQEAVVLAAMPRCSSVPDRCCTLEAYAASEDAPPATAAAGGFAGGAGGELLLLGHVPAGCAELLVQGGDAAAAGALLGLQCAGPAGHRALRRSQTVAYFRRGRFLVQTTYT